MNVFFWVVALRIVAGMMIASILYPIFLQIWRQERCAKVGGED